MGSKGENHLNLEVLLAAGGKTIEMVFRRCKGGFKYMRSFEGRSQILFEPERPEISFKKEVSIYEHFHASGLTYYYVYLHKLIC